jgi:hypothetical protein
MPHSGKKQNTHEEEGVTAIASAFDTAKVLLAGRIVDWEGSIDAKFAAEKERAKARAARLLDQEDRMMQREQLAEEREKAALERERAAKDREKRMDEREAVLDRQIVELKKMMAQMMQAQRQKRGEGGKKIFRL